MSAPRLRDCARIPRLAVFLLICAAAALWIDFSRHHRGHHSDSIVPVLVSLQHWTPFYWEQSRFGMLVPLLAAPVTHPLGNLLLQNGLTIFAGLAALGLLVRFLVRSWMWLPIALAACAVWLGCLSEPLRFEYFAAQPYGVALALGLAALVLVERRGAGRWCAAVGLMTAASWVNLTVGPTLLLLTGIRAMLERRLRGKSLACAAGWRVVWAGRYGRWGALLFLGTLAGGFLERVAEFRDPQQLRAVRLPQWLPSGAALAGNGWRESGPAFWRACAVLAALGVAGLLLRRKHGLALRGSAALVAAAGLFWLLAARSRWVALNDHAPRYLLPALATLVAGLATWAAAPWLSRRCGRGRAAATTLAATALLGATAYSYGTPSLSQVRAALDEKLGRHTPRLLGSGCTHVAGPYASTWTAVFHANWKLHERRKAGCIEGISYRSLPLLRQRSASSRSAAVIVVLGPDQHAEQHLAEFFAPQGARLAHVAR